MGKQSKNKRERRAHVPSVKLEDRSIEFLKLSIESQLSGDRAGVSVYSLAALGNEVKARATTTKSRVDVERTLHDLEWVATGLLNGVMEEAEKRLDTSQGVGYNPPNHIGEEVTSSDSGGGDSGDGGSGDPILDPTASGSPHEPATFGGEGPPTD
jgi:hypothetical protein